MEGAPAGGAYFLSFDRGSFVTRLGMNGRPGRRQPVTGPAPFGEVSDVVVGPSGDRAIMWLDVRDCGKASCTSRPVGARWPRGRSLGVGVPLAELADTLEFRTAINARGTVLSVWEAYPRGFEAAVAGRSSPFRATAIPDASQDGSLWRVDRTSGDRFVVLTTRQVERRTTLYEHMVDRFGTFGPPRLIVPSMDLRFPGFHQMLTDARGRQTAIASRRNGDISTVRAAVRRVGGAFSQDQVLGRGRYVDSATGPRGHAAVLFTSREGLRTTTLRAAVRGADGSFGRPRTLTRRAIVNPVDAAVTVDARDRVHAVWREYDDSRRSSVRSAVKASGRPWRRARVLQRLSDPRATCDSFILRGTPSPAPVLGLSCGDDWPHRMRLFTYR